MKKIIVTLLTCLSLFTYSSPKLDKPSVYLDCGYGCDLDYMKKELSFVDFYIDPNSVNVHIIVSSEVSGNGGSQITFRFIGRDVFDGVSNSLTLMVPPNSTLDYKRKEYVKIIQKGLYPYVIQTTESKNVQINYTKEDTSVVLVEEEDKWNNWVFRMGANGYVIGEEGYSNKNYGGRLTVNRITKKSKFTSSFNLSNSITEYDYDDYSFTSKRKTLNINSTYVLSLNKKLSTGLKSNFIQSTYSNLDYGLTLSPCIEYNFYPYSESSEHRFSVLYGISTTFNDYTDTTVYLKTNEVYPSQLLDIQYNNYQTWGSVELGVSGKQIIDLDDMKKYNVGLWGSVDVNIAKGLILNMYYSLDFDRAQIELPGGGATYEETILRQRELESGYYFYTSFGISYTFGSMKNNVVNPRF